MSMPLGSFIMFQFGRLVRILQIQSSAPTVMHNTYLPQAVPGNRHHRLNAVNMYKIIHKVSIHNSATVLSSIAQTENNRGVIPFPFRRCHYIIINMCNITLHNNNKTHKTAMLNFIMYLFWPKHC